MEFPAVIITAPEPIRKARAYAERGFSVFPTYSARDGGCSCRKAHECRNPAKHPHVRRGFHDATTDSVTITRWWERSPSDNVGLATGAVSGVIAIDVDPRHDGNAGLARMTVELGNLPETCEASTGGGGRHLLFTHPGPRVASRSGIGQGVDVRADGGYIVVDPSVHVSGKSYAWLSGRDLFTMTPASLPTAWLEFLLQPAPIMGTKTPPGSQPGSRSDATEAICGSLPWGNFKKDSLRDSVERAIYSTLPIHTGTRNRMLLELARSLKAIPSLADARPSDLEDVILRWHSLALPNISTRDVRETRADFSRAWRRVKYARGSEPFAAIAAKALSSDPPGIAFRYDRPGQRALVALCCELQRSAGDAPFYLSCRTAGRLLGVNFATASRWLSRLIDDGVIEVAAKANRLKMKATRFRYRGGS